MFTKSEIRSTKFETNPKLETGKTRIPFKSFGFSWFVSDFGFRHSNLLPGFTLMEILMAMVIMTVALVPIMQLMPQGMQATRRLERLAQASFLAQQTMEDMRRVMLAPDYAFNSTNNTTSATAYPAPFNSYKYNVSDNVAAGIKNISVTVWFDANNNSAMDTYSGAYQENEPSVKLDTRVAYRR